jgi:hypothetical protein
MYLIATSNALNLAALGAPRIRSSFLPIKRSPQALRRRAPKQEIRRRHIYRTRAAAGTGRACGLGASPTPDLRESARAVPRIYRTRAAAGMRGALAFGGCRRRRLVAGQSLGSSGSAPIGPEFPRGWNWLCGASVFGGLEIRPLLQVLRAIGGVPASALG